MYGQQTSKSEETPQQFLVLGDSTVLDCVIITCPKCVEVQKTQTGLSHVGKALWWITQAISDFVSANMLVWSPRKSFIFIINFIFVGSKYPKKNTF